MIAETSETAFTRTENPAETPVLKKKKKRKEKKKQEKGEKVRWRKRVAREAVTLERHTLFLN